jgi:hypothetical protein
MATPTKTPDKLDFRAFAKLILDKDAINPVILDRHRSQVE